MGLAIKMVDFIFGIGLFANAVLFIPQAIKIYKNKHAQDISLVTFSGFVLIQLSGSFYGYLHQVYVLMAGCILSFITCGTVTLLAFWYKKSGRNPA